MEAFEWRSWHVLLLFFTVIVGIFKSEIGNAINAFLIVQGRKYVEKEKIQILSSSGVWEDATIIDYSYEIPFSKKRGGVLVQYKNGDGNIYEEKFSFALWTTQRTRWLDTVAG
jgi:hypothetical protein